MLCNYFSEKMLGLQDAIVKNVENTDKCVLIHIRMQRKAHKCPACGNETDRVHDYRKQKIKDLPLFGKPYKIVLEKRAYEGAAIKVKSGSTVTFCGSGDLNIVVGMLQSYRQRTRRMR